MIYILWVASKKFEDTREVRLQFILMPELVQKISKYGGEEKFFLDTSLNKHVSYVSFLNKLIQGDVH